MPGDNGGTFPDTPRSFARLACMNFIGPICRERAAIYALLGALACLQNARAADTESPRRSLDQYGDPLPTGAIVRLGTTRFRHGGPVPFVRYALDDKVIVSAGGDAAVRIWDAETGKELHTIRPGPGFRFDPWMASMPVAMSGDGHTLATMTERGAILWDAATAKEKCRLDLLTARNREHEWSIALSPDGAVLAAESAAENEIQIWDVSRRQKKHSLPLDWLHAPFVLHVVTPLAFSPNGRLLAHEDHIWDLTTDKVMCSFQDAAWGSLCFSPDGRYLAAGGPEEYAWGPHQSSMDRGTASIWDVFTGKLWHEFPDIPIHTYSLKTGHSLRFFPDGKRAVFADRFIGIHLWDLQGECKTIVRWSNVLDMFMSRDGRHLACATGSGAIRIWDLPNSREITPVQTSVAPVRGIAFGTRTDVVASIGGDGALRCWQYPSGQQLMCYGTDQGCLPQNESKPAVAFIDDDRRLRVTGWPFPNDYDEKFAPPIFRDIDSASGKVRVESSHRGGFSKAELDSSGRILAYMNWDHWGILNAPTGHRLLDRQNGGYTITRRIALSRQGSLVAIAGYESGMGAQPRSPDLEFVAVYKMPDGALLKRWEVGAGIKTVDALTFSADGATLFASRDEKLLSGNLKTLEEQPTKTFADKNVAGEGSQISSIACSGDGKLIALGGQGVIQLRELPSMTERCRFHGHSGPSESLVFDPTGHRLASGGADTTVLIWDLSRQR